MAITPRGSTLAGAQGTALASLTFDSTANSGAAGDLIVFAALVGNSGKAISSIAGHGATWLAGPRLSVVSNGTAIEMWMGEVVTAGNTAITPTWGGGNAGIFCEYVAFAYNGGFGVNTTWAIDTPTGAQDNAANTKVTYPTLTPDGVDELYVGFSYGELVALNSTSTTAGFTGFAPTVADNGYIHNPDVDAVVSPVSGSFASQITHSIAMLITATGPPASTTGLFLPF